MRGPLLCTHVGISGPVVLDMSRHLLQARRDDVKSTLVVSWLPERSPERLDRDLRALQNGSIGAFLAKSLPERLARALCQAAGVEATLRGSEMKRSQRAILVRHVTAMPLPITGSRGFAVAEATAGGVPLAELRLQTLESRRQSGLFVCGEVCDVDGRIGGFNFHWAWASGFVAGCGAAAPTSLTEETLDLAP
jgi:predicted Rossmann fold flavoprotein